MSIDNRKGEFTHPDIFRAVNAGESWADPIDRKSVV